MTDCFVIRVHEELEVFVHLKGSFFHLPIVSEFVSIFPTSGRILFFTNHISDVVPVIDKLNLYFVTTKGKFCFNKICFP